MSTFKTHINAELVDKFLFEKYNGKATKAQFIKGGEISQAFSYEVGKDQYVVRINKHGEKSFQKDKYAYSNFYSPTLPIPEIVDIGKMDENYYAISKRVRGDTILNFPNKDIANIIPEFLKALSNIHSEDISSKPGYGNIDIFGKGTASSWKEEVLGISKQDWKQRFDTTFMEKELYEKLYSKLLELSVFCPEDRYLVHGDYSFDNVLSDGKEITGVIDWAQSMYGDFLYDIAWISFWPSSMNYADQFKKYYTEKGIPLNYDKRILGYQVWIALNSLGFYSYSNQKDKYDWAKNRIISLLDD